MKEVVRRSSTGGGVTPVERSWPRAQFCSWQGEGGCAGRLPSDPQEPADVERGDRSWLRLPLEQDSDCSWSAKALSSLELQRLND